MKEKRTCKNKIHSKFTANNKNCVILQAVGCHLYKMQAKPRRFFYKMQAPL